MNAQLLERAQILPIAEQIELVAAIWNGLVNRGDTIELTPSQAAELDRRRQAYMTQPGEVVTWATVKADAQMHLKML